MSVYEINPQDGSMLHNEQTASLHIWSRFLKQCNLKSRSLDSFFKERRERVKSQARLASEPDERKYQSWSAISSTPMRQLKKAECTDAVQVC